MSKPIVFRSRRRQKVVALGFLAVVATTSTGTVRPARAFIVETAAAGALIGHFGDVASDLIDKGRDSGDFLIWRLGIQLQGLIDTWKKANSGLLTEGFEKLDRSAQDFFRKLDSEIEQVRNEKDVSFDQVERLTGEWSAIISQTVIGSGDASVFNYYPRVLVPDGASSIRLTVTGNNLSTADATADIGTRHSVIPAAPLSQEIQFSLKRSEFTFSDEESKSVTIPMTYRPRPSKWYKPWTWFSSERSKSDLTFILLPKRMAKYEIHTRVNKEAKLTEARTVNLGQFRGRNSRLPRAVAAPDSGLGWRIDLTRRPEIHLVPGGGDHGRCEGIEDASITENGLTMFARLDNRDDWRGRRDAWVDCSISLPIYRMEPQEQDGPSKSGILNWTRDETFELPPGLKSIQVIVTTFDGRTRTFTGAGADRFFDIKSEGGLVIFRPRPPKDL